MGGVGGGREEIGGVEGERVGVGRSITVTSSQQTARSHQTKMA